MKNGKIPGSLDNEMPLEFIDFCTASVQRGILPSGKIFSLNLTSNCVYLKYSEAPVKRNLPKAHQS